jgi:hypothetical protein
MKRSLDVTGFPYPISVPSPSNLAHDLLLGCSKANSSLAEVIDGVPLSEECVTENCQWAYGLREVLQED